MRRTYLKCDKCGKGHAHNMPRPGKDQMSLGNQWSWDKTQYKKCARVLCTTCKIRELNRYRLL